MALMGRATHVLQWALQRVTTARARVNLQKRSQSGLKSETRLYEVGIASNRKSERFGEYVPGSCTHCPSRHGSELKRK